MKPIFIEDKRNTQIVAHRGLSGIERENTLPAFVAAGNRSCFGIECDVHVTKDGQYLVYHDDTTGRLCEKDISLEASTAEQLRGLRIKDAQSDEFTDSLKMPALSEYLAGKRVMVTVGPTREPWDGVRYWSNPSSGRMGGALAVAAWLRGATVTAVCGPGCPGLPSEIRRLDVGTAREMFEAAADIWPDMDCGCFCAAVADFSPVPHGPEKFKKEGAEAGFSVSFAPNPDILRTLAARRRADQRLLGFAAETAPDMDSLLALARAKRARKDADLLAGNCVNSAGCGFGCATNSMAVTDRHGHEEIWPQQNKADVAWDLLTWLLRI